jgi:alpha-glucosidase (family GH31 glycosyl hydrolase)
VARLAAKIEHRRRWSKPSVLHGPYNEERSFSLDQVPLYRQPGAFIPMQPPMLNTGEKPVDPLILHILPLNDS